MVEYFQKKLIKGESLQIGDNQFSNPLSTKAGSEAIVLSEYTQEQKRPSYDEDISSIIEVVIEYFAANFCTGAPAGSLYNHWIEYLSFADKDAFPYWCGVYIISRLNGLCPNPIACPISCNIV